MSLITAKDSMLLVIDVQENFYGAHRTDVDRDVLEPFFDRVAWIVAVAKAAGVPVVVTEEWPADNGATVARVAERLPAHATVLPKEYFAAPDNPDILRAIEATKKSTVVVVGLETDICVAHSALRLQDRGKDVVAVTDALFSPGEAHEHGLRRMEASGVQMVSAKGVFYDWVRSVTGLLELTKGDQFLSNPPGFHL